MLNNEIKILRKLSFDKQLAFAYLACERTFYYYEYPCNKFNFGDPKILLETAQFIREHLFAPLDLVEENTPDILHDDSFWPAIANFVYSKQHNHSKRNFR